MAETKDAVPTTQTPEAPKPGPGQIQVNVDYLKTTRVHICMPCYGGMLTESCFMSDIKWANTCRQLGIDWTMETMTNESLITRARNTLTAKFLSNPDYLEEKWSKRYKRSINCARPRGFSQRAHCAGRKKKS